MRRMDPKLEEAARKSPEIAAMLAGVHRDPGPGYRRIVALVAAAAVGVAGVWFAGSALGPKRAEAPPREPATEIDTSVYLAPPRTEPSGRDEETAPFGGFAVSVDSEPPGAVVTVAGKVRGEAPVLTDVACSGAEKVEIRAEKKGFRPARRLVACRADTLVKLTLRLER